MVRSFEELSTVDESAWPGLLAQLNRASIPVRVLPVEADVARETLFRLQVTVRSTLGALASNCGGLLVDHGWLRVLGGSADGLPSLSEANQMSDPSSDSAPPSVLIVAFDVLGGKFAINGGGLVGGQGEVCYFGPDTLRWIPIGGGHSQLVSWAVSGGLSDFYEHLRWPGWEEEVASIPTSHGIAAYPFLFTEEGRNLATSNRRPVPFGELLYVQDEIVGQLDTIPDGTAFQVRAED